MIYKKEMNNQGLTLIEMVITLSILSFLSVAIFLNANHYLDSLTLNQQKQEIYNLLSEARMRAIATDEDILYTQINQNSVIKTKDKIIKTIPHPPKITLKLSNDEIGFKPTCTTKKAGTITIRSASKEEKIKVGVGLGIISQD